MGVDVLPPHDPPNIGTRSDGKTPMFIPLSLLPCLFGHELYDLFDRPHGGW